MRACKVPYDDPVECLRCGYLTSRRRLGSDGHCRQSLAGIAHVAPGACEPAEYVTTCPDCGATESFDEAIRCAECLEYPCVCEAGNNERF